MQNAIRVVALAAIIRPGTDEFLVFTGKDETRDLVYNRPFGGGINFGETAAEAIRREVMEEIGYEVVPGRLLGTAEAIFTMAGRARHEVILVVEAAFRDKSLYLLDVSHDHEGNGEHGTWRTISSPTVLFPEIFPSMLKDADLVG